MLICMFLVWQLVMSYGGHDFWSKMLPALLRQHRAYAEQAAWNVAHLEAQCKKKQIADLLPAPPTRELLVIAQSALMCLSLGAHDEVCCVPLPTAHRSHRGDGPLPAQKYLLPCSCARHALHPNTAQQAGTSHTAGIPDPSQWHAHDGHKLSWVEHSERPTSCMSAVFCVSSAHVMTASVSTSSTSAGW